MLRLTQQQQQEVIRHIQDVFTNYEEQTSEWRERMTAIYKWVTTFKEPKLQPRETGFKVNKMHEYENRMLPRIMSKQPKPIVSYSTDDYIDNQDIKIDDLTSAVEARLEEIYEKQDMIESLRLRAKAGIRYWLAFAKLMPKYRIKRTPQKTWEVEYDEQGNEVIREYKKVSENIYEQYTSIEIKSFVDMYFDPRYTRLEDMPSIIDVSRNVRLSYFTRNKKKFMNIDRLIECCMWAKDYLDIDWYKQRVSSILWVQAEKVKLIKPDNLDVKCYYGYYDLSDSKWLENEKLYEFWVVQDTILVYACEIAFMPYEDFRVFEDTETCKAIGLLEPILGLQDEMNRKKNRASEYINKTLKPSYIYSPASWLDPRKFNQWHGNILITTATAQTAIENFQELPLKDLHPSYFNEQNDFERQFQSATFTINTNSPITQNSLTNTATGAKIQSFETDAVAGEIRKHFEEALVRLSYKILQSEYDNTTENIKVKDKNSKDAFWIMHREALRDAVSKYKIKIQAWSSSFDSEEARRNDAIAQWNIALQARQAGLNVNLKKVFERIMRTFPNIDLQWLFEQSMQQTMPVPQQMKPQAPIEI